VFTEQLLRNGLHNPVILLFFGADRIEKTALSTVAWQRVDQIHYGMLKVTNSWSI
jgi:hypothetical protein